MKENHDLHSFTSMNGTSYRETRLGQVFFSFADLVDDIRRSACFLAAY